MEPTQGVGGEVAVRERRLDRPPRFIGSEIYRRSRYGGRHPLSIPRVSTCMDLCRALGWLPDEQYLDSPRATPAELTRFHDPAYVAALQRIEHTQVAEMNDKRRHNLGVNGNPVFPEIFTRPATAAGAALLAGRLVAEGATVYSPAGGTHHGQPDRASGFCYFNDPALAILTLLDRGVAPVFYLDLDAHHGDGVQAAFATDPRVMTVSIHEQGRWPMRPGVRLGGVEDRGGGFARNLPVPAGFNDSELAFLMENAVIPLAEVFEPQVVVLQCGADALEEDPLSRLALSNGALWRAVAACRSLAPRLLVLGGGGYNPWSVGRCWAGVWGVLNGHPMPERLPPQAEAVLRALFWQHSRGRNPPEPWFTTLADRPRPGPLRAEVRALASAVLS
jgi:acetoin utilization protein AcuC